MDEILLNDIDYLSLSQKYKMLINHNKFKDLLLEYINNIIPNTNHDWINYITYLEKSNKIIISFKKFKIETIKNDIIVTNGIIEKLVKNIIYFIKKNSLLLPICYLADIININNVNNLLQKKSNEFKLQINFKIINDKIKFYIKYNEFFECKINEVNILINEIYNKYIKIERSKKKIIFLIDDATYFNCEDTLYELQSYMFNNNYWLDIAFNFNLNSFQNTCILNNKILYFIKYDIILLYNGFGFIDKINFQNIKNKLIITIPIRLTPDRLYQAFRKDTDFKNLNNNIIFWGKIKLEDIDNGIMLKTATQNDNMTFEFYNNTILHYLFELSNNKINKSTVSTDYMNVLLPNTDNLNNNLLEKEDFFNLYDFDIKKKLITLFIRWPKCTFEPSDLKYYNTMRQLYIKNSFIHDIINSLKDDYNILFKGHPAYFKKINNINYFSDDFHKRFKKSYYGFLNDKLIISIKKTHQEYRWYKDGILIHQNSKLIFESIKYTDIGIYELFCDNIKYQFTISIKKNYDSLHISECNSNNSYIYLENINLDYEWTYKKYPGLELLNKYNFLNDEYTNEIYKYSNFTIIFSNTTTTLDNSLYNIPVLLISSKEKSKDWFNLEKYYFKKLSTEEKNKLGEKCNNINVFNKSIYNEGLNGVCCGEKIYWEDINDDLIVKLRNIIEKEEIYKKDFLKENPYFGTSHTSTQNEVGKEIIKIINKTNFDQITNNLKYNICHEAITIYENSYIDILIKNNIITMKILKEPYVNNKLLGYGLHLYLYNIEPKCKINLVFNIKLNDNEDDIYFRLYTGIRWIIYDMKLSNNFTNFNIQEDFDLANRSKWRLSTTSKKINQEIVIKDLHFSNEI